MISGAEVVNIRLIGCGTWQRQNVIKFNDFQIMTKINGQANQLQITYILKDAGLTRQFDGISRPKGSDVETLFGEEVVSFHGSILVRRTNHRDPQIRRHFLRV